MTMPPKSGSVFQATMRFDGERTTVIVWSSEEPDSTVTLVAAGDPVLGQLEPRLCGWSAVAARPAHGSSQLPAPTVYFTSDDDARWFIEHTNDLWKLASEPAKPAQECRYRLLEEGCSVPLPAAGGYLPGIDEVMHLAAYWVQASEQVIP
jgi:hypothetical protein